MGKNCFIEFIFVFLQEIQCINIAYIYIHRSFFAGKRQIREQLHVGMYLIPTYLVYNKSSFDNSKSRYTKCFSTFVKYYIKLIRSLQYLYTTYRESSPYVNFVS